MLESITEKRTTISADIIKVGDLLKCSNLMIPVYQRPYKWTIKNVNQLIDDILFHEGNISYRFGTIVLHDDDTYVNIVDGQQRTITLLLIAKAILDDEDRILNKELTDYLDDLNDKMIDPKLGSDISINNIQENYQVILRRIKEFSDHTVAFLFKQCEFIKYTLVDITEAFQFFDSQNARGKDLEPHDLLKAFHLREFSQADDVYKDDVVHSWEQSSTKELSMLFSNYLFRVRKWTDGMSARYFNKDDVSIFKGINLDSKEKWPYSQLIRIAHFYLDRYNESFERKIDLHNADFPFQMDQIIINGRRFFEMISYYKELFDRKVKKDSLIKDDNLNQEAKSIIILINSYKSRNRTGDKYVRILFDCALLYYIDKFGEREISLAIQIIFIWAYTVRMNYQSVQLATIDNYVTQEKNIFRHIKQITDPRDLRLLVLNTISENSSSKTSDILEKFKELKYYADSNQRN